MRARLYQIKYGSQYLIIACNRDVYDIYRTEKGLMYSYAGKAAENYIPVGTLLHQIPGFLKRIFFKLNRNTE